MVSLKEGISLLAPSPNLTGRRRSSFMFGNEATTTRKLSCIPNISGTPNQTSTSNNQEITKDNKIKFNVGGMHFETYKTTLAGIPDTRLAWLVNSPSGTDYDPDTGEYFFDRHPIVFNMVLNYYRTGKLHIPMEVCGPMFEEELAFWGIDERLIEPCCWTIYRTHRDAQETLAELYSSSSEEDTPAMEHEYDFKNRNSSLRRSGKRKSAFFNAESKWHVVRKFHEIRPLVWAYLDEPRRSKISTAAAAVSMGFILLSIVLIALETIPKHRLPFNVTIYHDLSKSSYKVRDMMAASYVVHPIRVMDCLCTFYFTIEILTRLLFCPDKHKFFKCFLNWIDISALISTYFIYIFLSVTSSAAFEVLIQILNFPRFFRIFKLVRHFKGLKIILHTMKASSQELLLLFVVFGIFVVLWGTAVYICEQIFENEGNHFKNILFGFWWALSTMTTVGYGDVVPKTFFGYLVGVFCNITGVLVIAMPVPIIVNNFATYYNHAQARLKMPKRPKQRLVGAADALKQQCGMLPTGSYANHADSEPSSSIVASLQEDGSNCELNIIDEHDKSTIKTGECSNVKEIIAQSHDAEDGVLLFADIESKSSKYDLQAYANANRTTTATATATTVTNIVNQHVSETARPEEDISATVTFTPSPPPFRQHLEERRTTLVLPCIIFNDDSYGDSETL